MFFHCWHRDCDGNELMSSVVCETTTDDRLSKLNLYELEIMTRVWSVIRVCSVVISQDGKTQQKTDVSPVFTVSSFSYLHGFTFFLRQSQVHVGKKTKKPTKNHHELKTERFVRNSQSETNHWPSTSVIALITVCQKKVSGPQRWDPSEGKLTLSLSISVKTQRWTEKTARPNRAHRNWIHHRWHSKPELFIKTQGFPVKSNQQVWTERHGRRFTRCLSRFLWGRTVPFNISIYVFEHFVWSRHRKQWFKFSILL